MSVADTFIWLVDFPVTHAFVIVFIAGFSLAGLLTLSFRSVGGDARLAAVRAREGLVEAADDGRARPVLGRVQQWVFRILTVVMAGALVLGILGLVGVPVTSAYIHAQGRPAVATVEGEWVTFTTAVGESYTLHNDFFSPSQYPDRDAWIPSDAQVVVRYLPDHPQAFVIDTDQLPE